LICIREQPSHLAKRPRCGFSVAAAQILVKRSSRGKGGPHASLTSDRIRISRKRLDRKSFALNENVQ
jgi:hypothetical protein